MYKTMRMLAPINEYSTVAMYGYWPLDAMESRPGPVVRVLAGLLEDLDPEKPRASITPCAVSLQHPAGSQNYEGLQDNSRLRI